jgi:hypothetical protein
VRFDEPDFAGSLREGRGDPLAGGEVEGRSSRDRFVAGKLSPRWGRGLLLGSSGDPWQRGSARLDGGLRGRAGEGVMVSRGESSSIELMAGRFARRDLAGARAARGPLGAGFLIGRGRELQSSISVRRSTGETEWVFDRRGRWRSEGVLERRLGTWLATGSVRAGAETFRSLAEPGRRGPTRAMTLALGGPAPWGEVRALASQWRFRPAQAGSRVGIECRRSLDEQSRLTWGFEQQRGVRREDASPTDALRQGGWLEWAGSADPMSLGVRHELWGARPWLRDVVRSVTSIRVDARLPFGTSATLAHSIYRTRRGESLYLAETESDRLVLRALSGEGQRSRLELSVPAGKRGRLRATVLLSASAGTPRPPQWTVEWVRRSRPERPSPESSP